MKLSPNWWQCLSNKYFGWRYVQIYRGENFKITVRTKVTLGKVEAVTVHRHDYLLNSDGSVWGSQLKWRRII